MTNDKRQTAANGKQWQPPRGITLPRFPNRPERPFGVQWWVDGKRKTKTFPTAGAQVEFAKQLAGDVESVGIEAFRLNADETREWRAFKAQIAPASLDAVLACWNRHGRPDLNPMTVKEAIVQFLAAKKAEGLHPLTLGHYRPVMARIEARLGPLVAAQVTREQVAEWLEGLDCAPVTRGREFAYARGFFHWLKVARIIPDNPCDGLKRPKSISKQKPVIPVADARSLFANNKRYRELCGRLALEAFAGIRYSSASKIVAADISFKDRGLELPADKLKTEQREYLQGFTPNLWRWLRWSDPSIWTMTPRQYLEAKSKAFVRADIPHPRNVLRHSFATYDLALFADVSGTAARLAHSSPKTLFRDYKGRGTKSDGKAYFRIMP